LSHSFFLKVSHEIIFPRIAHAPHIDELHNSPTKFISGHNSRNRFVKTTNQMKLVQIEIAYLRPAAKMFSASDEAERMQYVGAELSVLQKLVLLRDKFKRVIAEDRVEKLVLCKTHPDTCK
jgi:hypothetical protein